MKYIKKIETLILFTKYCFSHHLPFLKTFQQFNTLRKEKKVGFQFLILCDYPNNKDNLYLFNDYIDKSLQLNSEIACDLMDNKTTLYKRCPHLLGRDYLILAESSEEEIRQFFQTHTRFVGKRNYGSFGKQFSVYDTANATPEELLESLKQNGQVLLEDYIVQHDVLSHIYPHSVNTLRIHTVNNGSEIRSFIKPKLRIGCDNSTLDANSETGSYRLIVNESGIVEMAAYVDADYSIQKADKHHNTNVSFDQVIIPYVKEAIALTIEAASFFPELPYIGWDVAITPTGPVLVEGNSISGCFNTYQIIHYLYHGVGLKKEIDEMLDFGLNKIH